VIQWQETMVTVKKEALPLFVSVNALLFFHTVWTC